MILLNSKTPQFPDPNSAALEPDGLLAVGGNLSCSTLLSAYRMGIFPWFSEGDPLLWWSPSIRCVLDPHRIHISKSLNRQLRQQRFDISIDQAFPAVIKNCADRKDNQGTWITNEMIAAYVRLHQQGHAHSIEVWQDSDLIGGIYGLAIGGIFCGESMFSHRANASKIAMVYLCRHLIKQGYSLLDCQIVSDHLLSMGATSMNRQDFLNLIATQNNRSIDWL